MLRSLPNLITILRLFLVPVVIWLLLEEQVATAFWVFLAAGILDGVDGALARVLNARTELGSYLDPLADKALMDGVYITLGAIGLLPSWLVIMVVFRDVLIIGGVLLLGLVNGTVSMRPLIVSKLNTVMQIALAALVLAVPALGLDDRGAVAVLIWAVAATTVASAAAYVYVWTQRVLTRPNQDQTRPDTAPEDRL